MSRPRAAAPASPTRRPDRRRPPAALDHDPAAIRSLLEVSLALTQTLERDRVFDLIVQSVQRLLEAPFVGIMTLDDAGRELAYAKGAGLEPERLASLRLRVGEGIAGRAVAQRAPVQSSSIAQDPHYIRRGLAMAEGFRSLLCVPLLAQGRPLGCLVVFRRDEHEFSPQEIALLTAFSHQAALAMEGARLFHREQERRWQLEAVRAVTQDIARELYLPALLGLIHRRAGELVQAAGGSIWLWDEAAGVLVPQVWHGVGDWLLDLRPRPGEGAAGIVAQRREGLLVNDYRAWPHAHPAFLERASIGAVIAEPLLYRDRLIGVIVFHNEASGRPFAPQDRETLGLFSHQAAIAIENARLFAQVHRHAEHLEATVRDRTRELEEANRRLEAASRAKSEFVANMSHELRTPLTAIIGCAEVLEMGTFGPLAPKQARYVRNIVGSGTHLLDLVNDVLDLAKVEAGRLALHPEPTALPPIVAAALKAVGPQAEKKALALVQELDPGLPVFHVDPVRVQQVLANLLSNAVKFTPEGGRVTVRPACARNGAGPAGPAGGFVEIAVEDTGIGIAPEDLGRLFHKFEQLNGGPTNGQQGTGLGLALSRHLVELHGGTVAARSDGPGQGTTFTVRLPIAERGMRIAESPVPNADFAVGAGGSADGTPIAAC